MSEPKTATIEQRQKWLAVLARCSRSELERALAALPRQPQYGVVKPAESGLIMIRNRTGRSGSVYNMGEATVSRCVVAVADRFTGVGYVRGKDKRLAELVALFDALLQDDDCREDIERALIEPASVRQEEERDLIRRKAGATRVEFLTLVRGE